MRRVVRLVGLVVGSVALARGAGGCFNTPGGATLQVTVTGVAATPAGRYPHTAWLDVFATTCAADGGCADESWSTLWTGADPARYLVGVPPGRYTRIRVEVRVEFACATGPHPVTLARGERMAEFTVGDADRYESEVAVVADAGRCP